MRNEAVRCWKLLLVTSASALEQKLIVNSGSGYWLGRTESESSQHSDVTE